MKKTIDVEEAVAEFQEKIQAAPISLDNARQDVCLNLQVDGKRLKEMSDLFKKRFRDQYGTSHGLYLRAELILEEVAELFIALAEKDEVKILDGCIDAVYVIVGTATALGLPFIEGFAEVHRSNMTKGTNAANHDGDKGKGAEYSPPDLQSIIDKWRF